MILQLKNEVYKQIRNDLALRKKIANVLAISDQTILVYAKRKARRLNDYNVIKAIMEYTGKDEESIFDKPTSVQS